MSGDVKGNHIDIAAVTDGEAAGRSGVAHAETLVAFAEAVVQGRGDELAQAREVLLEELGPEALVDAAAVVANFQRMVRIADGTGISLDAGVAAMTTDIRSELRIDEFQSAANTLEPGAAT